MDDDDDDNSKQFALMKLTSRISFENNSRKTLNNYESCETIFSVVRILPVPP